MKNFLRVAVATSLSSLALLQAGCSNKPLTVPESQTLGVETMPDGQADSLDKKNNRHKNALELEQQSDLLHNFLVGQLALDTEDRTRAYLNLKKANALTEEPIIQNQVGQLLLSQNKLVEARKEFLKILSQSKPTAVSDEAGNALFIAAWISVLNGEASQASDLLEKYSTIQPQARERSILKAAVFLSQNNPAQATTFLEGQAQDPVVAFMAARLNEEQQKLEPAIGLYKKAAADPVLAREALIGIARIGYKQGLPYPTYLFHDLPVAKEAESFRDELASRLDKNDLAVAQDIYAEPDTIQSAKKLIALSAQDNLRGQNIELAFDELYLGLAKDPSDPNRYQLAGLLAQAGRMQEASDLMLQIPPSSEWYVRARVFSGITLRQINKLGKAEKVLRDGLAHAPATDSLESVLLLVLRQDKKYAEAKQLYQTIMAREPANEHVLFSYGVLLQEMGNEEEALSVMDQIATKNPNNAEALNYVAYALAEVKRDLPRAEQMIARALSLQPKNAFFIDTQAWVYFSEDKLPEALTTIKKAIAIEPNDPEVLEHYGDILAKNSDLPTALKIYDQAKDAARLSDEPDAKERADRIAKKIQAIPVQK